MWLIERVSQEDETVHLWKMEVGTRRKFSVPGALTATIESGKLLVHSSTGWMCELDPKTGARRRFPIDLLEDPKQK